MNTFFFISSMDRLLTISSDDSVDLNDGFF